MWSFIFRLHEICYLNVKNNKSCDFFVFLVHGDISLNMNSTNVIFYISAAWNMLFKKTTSVWFFCIFGTWRYLVKYEFNKCDFLYFAWNMLFKCFVWFFCIFVHGDISLNMNSTNVIFYISSAWNMLKNNKSCDFFVFLVHGDISLYEFNKCIFYMWWNTFKCEKQQVVWFFCIFGTWRYLVKYEFNKCDFLYFGCMKYVI